MPTETKDKMLTQEQCRKLSDEQLENCFDEDQISKTTYKAELNRRARVKAVEDVGGLKPNIWYVETKDSTPEDRKYTRKKVLMIQLSKNTAYSWVRKIRESETLAEFDGLTDKEIIAQIELDNPPPWDADED